MPATTRFWTGNIDSDYSNASNWDTSFPASTDTAVFDATAKTTTVTNTNTAETAAAAWIFNGGNYYTIISGGGSPFFFSFNGTGVQVNAGSVVIKVVQDGRIGFFGHSDAGNAEYDINTNGIIHFETTVGPNGDNKLHIGSIEAEDGTASIVLGAGQQLFVGGNNLDTNYVGSINAASGTPGSLVKVGTGTLTLSGAVDALQSLTIEGGTVTLAGSRGADIGEIDFAPPGGA